VQGCATIVWVTYHIDDGGSQSCEVSTWWVLQQHGGSHYGIVASCGLLMMMHAISIVKTS
jgi:hypothetical protein